METQFQFNTIYVLQSLNDHDLQTGERLVQQQLKPKLGNMGFGLHYWKIRDRSAFLRAMDEVWMRCAERTKPRVYPIIHIDTHGASDQSGIAMLPSGETVSWAELYDKCQRINQEVHNNLLVASAMCYGLHAITEVSIRSAAPFLGLVGPQEAVEASLIDVGFGAFYSEVLHSGDLDSAMHALGRRFKLFHADKLFVGAFTKYLKQSCKGAGQERRIERLLAEWMGRNADHNLDEETARRILTEYTSPNPASFERFKKRFLMSDHPLNAGRFDDITFELVHGFAGRSV